MARMTNIPESWNREVAKKMREAGVELTPEEIREKRRMVHERLRRKLLDLGIEPPDGELELAGLMRQLLGNVDIEQLLRQSTDEIREENERRYASEREEFERSLGA